MTAPSVSPMSATAAPTSGIRVLLEQLTDDHTVVAEQLAAGHISPADAVTHPQRSMLTRVLGISPEIEVDSISFDTERGRPASDLLRWSHQHGRGRSDRQLLAKGSPEEAVWALIEEANRAGGHDNITVVVVDVEQ